MLMSQSVYRTRIIKHCSGRQGSESPQMQPDKVQIFHQFCPRKIMWKEYGACNNNNYCTEHLISDNYQEGNYNWASGKTLSTQTKNKKRIQLFNNRRCWHKQIVLFSRVFDLLVFKLFNKSLVATVKQSLWAIYEVLQLTCSLIKENKLIKNKSHSIHCTCFLSNCRMKMILQNGYWGINIKHKWIIQKSIVPLRLSVL